MEQQHISLARGPSHQTGVGLKAMAPAVLNLLMRVRYVHVCTCLYIILSAQSCRVLIDVLDDFSIYLPWKRFNSEPPVVPAHSLTGL